MFIGGWVLAVVTFFVIGTQSCGDVQVPLAGKLQVCQDTTSNAVILLTVIGFAATVGSIFLFALRVMILAMADVAENTRKGP